MIDWEILMGYTLIAIFLVQRVGWMGKEIIMFFVAGAIIGYYQKSWAVFWFGCFLEVAVSIKYIPTGHIPTQTKPTLCLAGKHDQGGFFFF